MDLFETLQKKHIELIDLTETSDVSEDQLFAEVENFIKELKDAGALIAESRQRNQLRTLLRYWGSHLYEQKGEFPDTQLLPVNIDVEREARLEQLYDKARKLFESKQWAEAILLCQQIIEESPDYKDVQDLLWKAKHELKTGESYLSSGQKRFLIIGIIFVVFIIILSRGIGMARLPSIISISTPTQLPIAAVSSPTPTPTHTLTATSTFTLTPSPTPTDTPSPTSTATGTPPPTATQTPLNLLPIESANLDQIEPVANLDAHEGPVLQAAFSSDGKLLASSGGDGMIKIWSAPNAQEIVKLSDQTGWVQTGVFSSDGLWLASGGNDRVVRLWDMARHQIFAEFHGHNGFVFSNAFHPDSSLLASSSGDGTVRLWDIGSGSQVAILEGGITEGGISAVYDVAFNPAGTELASGSIDGFVRLWDIATFDKVCEFSTASVLSVAYNPNGDSLASGNTRGHVILLSDRCQPERILEGHTDNVNSVAYSPDGQFLASGSRDRLVKVWPLTPTTAEPITLSEHLASVETVTFSPDGLLLVSGSADGKIIFWGIMGN